MKHPALSNIARLCRQAHSIFSSYYLLSDDEPDFEAFLLAPRDAFGKGGAVLLEETAPGESGSEEGTLSLGLCFGTELADDLLHHNETSLHTVAVVAEETSHFLTLVDAAKRDVFVSRLELETLGEIDRFLALLHWHHDSRLSVHGLCDVMFEGERFQKDAHLPLYVEAEARAFVHLRKAFAGVWESRGIDPRRVNLDAARYLRELREHILRPTPNQRRAA